MRSLDRHLQYFLAALMLGFTAMPGALWALENRFALDVMDITDTSLTDFYGAFYSSLNEPVAWFWLLLPYGLFIALRALSLQLIPAMRNALSGPVREDGVEGVETEIAKGTGADAGDQPGEVLLRTASEDCKAENVIMLLGSGADLNTSETVSGMTPLHKAAQNGCLQVCELLIRHGAEMDAQTHDGATALHLAALAGHDEVVALLLKYNPNHTLRDAEDRTALQCAQQAGHAHIAIQIERHIEKEWPYLHIANR